MKTLLSAISLSIVCLLILPLPAFSQDLNQGAGSYAPVAVVRPDSNGVEGTTASDTFVASEGTSETQVTLTWSVYQACLFGTFLEAKLYRDGVFVRTFGYPSTSYGQGWTQVWPDAVPPGESHTYQLVRHCTGTLCDNTWTSPLRVGSASPVKPPINLSVTSPGNSDKTIQMTWKNDSKIMTEFRVYKDRVLIATTQDSSYTVSTTPGVTARWGVATYAGAYSLASDIVDSSVSTSTFKKPEDFYAAKDTTVGYVRLGWTCASDYATQFKIFRDGAELAAIPAAQKWYLDTAITPGREYWYHVVSYNDVSGLSSNPSPDSLGRSAYLSASDGSREGQVYVSWSQFPPGFENGLRLYRDGVLVDGVFSGMRDKYDDLVTPGRIHQYRLEVLRNSQVVLTVYDCGFAPANGSVKALVTTPSGGAVKNVELRAYANASALNKSFDFDGVDDFVSAPALNLNSNTVTISAWIKRNGAQAEGAGIIVSRAGKTAAGLSLMGNGELRYTWNGASSDWSSGLIVPDGIWTYIALVVQPDSATLYLNDLFSVHAVSHQAEEFDGRLEIGRDAGPPSRYFKGTINEACVWNVARTPEQVAQDKHHVFQGVESGLVAYWHSPRSGVVGDYVWNGNHHGTPYGNPLLANAAPPVWNFAVTNGLGSCTVDDINWEPNDQFTIRPFLQGHGFTGNTFPEDSVVLPFTLSDHAYTGIHFIDTTAIEISGSVFLATVPSYPLPGVKVLLNGTPSGETSDSSGHFSTSVTERRNYTVAMQYLNHLFVPHDTVINVQGPVTNLVFRDTTKRSVHGRVYGGCDNFLGLARIRIRSLAAGYVDTTVQTDGTGQYEVRLPSQKYTAQLVSIANADSIAIISYFTRDTVDISQQDTVKTFLYHSPPIVRISELPPSGCGAYAVPIMEQERTYAVRFDVVERYGVVECPVGAGTVSIQDNIAYKSPDSVMALVNGRVYYPLIPGYPNLLGGGPHPHQKQMVVQTKYDRYTRYDTVWVFVRGHVPRSWDFTTVSPEIPFLILRDPPGDKSYSYISSQTSTAVHIGFSLEMEQGVGVYARLKAGGGAEVPGVGATGSWLSGQVQAEAGIREAVAGSLQVKITTSQTLKTSDSDKIVGSSGDVYMGAALNIKYALTDVLDYDTLTCSVVRDTAIAWNGNGFKTTYLYTESHIRESVIPKLQLLASVLAGSSDPAQRDSAVLVQNQLDVWQQVIDGNARLKQNGIHLPQYPNNVSFSGGTSLNQSVTTTVTKALSISLSLFFKGEAVAEMGAKAGDFYEVAGGVRVFAKVEIGASGGIAREEQNTVGFELADDDATPPGDVFSVDVLGDTVMGTPVFKLVGGSSSCPWEPGTQRREAVALNINPTVLGDVPPENLAAFDLYLYNLTETNETRTYKLALIQGSNPDGATIYVGGSPVGAGELPFQLPPNASNPQRATVNVGRLAGSVYDYDDLRLHLYSPCDPQVDTSVSFSVHFVKPCSDVRIAQPALNWIVNAASGQHQTVILKGYNAADPNLQKITCEYRAQGATLWTTLFDTAKALLPVDSMVHNWNMSALLQGTYELRASTVCAAGTFYTRTHTGVYDRTPPAAYGTPQPADGLLDPGDDIKIVFTELINAATADTAHIVLRNITRGTDIPIDITIGSSGAELVIAMRNDPTMGDSLRVTITGLEDPYGNVIAQPITWKFRANRTVGVEETPKPIPTVFLLEQSYPNPFNPSTTIRYGLPHRSDVRLTVYTMLGQKVAQLVEGDQEAGYYEIRFDATGLASGVYLYRIQAGDFVQTRKLLLVR